MFDENARKLLDELTSRVGLSRYQGALNLGDGSIPPESITVWLGSHAVLAVCFADPDHAAFDEATSGCVRWLADILDGWRHRRGRLFDGYLVMALRQPPEETQRAHLKQFELATNVCRRHVIWPEALGDWSRRISEIAVLGLPTAGTVTPPEIEVDLPDPAQQCLAWFSDSGANIVRVFEKLEVKAEAEAETEVNRAR